jgi:stage II sporulation protein AA (anti-sigma F factor antagonist)
MADLITNLTLLRIERAGEPPGAVLRCLGEIDLSNVDYLRQSLDASIQLPVPEVEVDLREVSFLDSSAIDALVGACHELAGQGRTLRVRATEWIARVLRMVKVDCLLKLCVD